MISGIPSIGAGVPAVAPTSAPATQQASAPLPVQPVDRATISDQGQAFLQAEILGMALILALLSRPGKKEKESVLLAELAVAAVVLQSMARLSPFILTADTANGRTYALVGDIQAVSQAVSSSNVGALFTGGVVALVGVSGG